MTEQRFETAVNAFRSGRMDEAELVCRALLAGFANAGPGVGQSQLAAQALNLLAVVLCQRGAFSEAISLLQPAIELRPDDIQALRTLGQALYIVGQFQAAVETYARACSLLPQDAGLVSKLGEALLQTGALELAEAAFRRAIALRPEVAGSHAALGVVLAEAGRLDEAEAVYRVALMLQPGASELHVGVGAVLVKQERTEEALIAYQAAAALAPQHAAAWLAEAHRTIGASLRRRGRMAEAIEMVARALVHDAANPDLVFELAVSLAEAGRAEDAIAAFTRVLDLNPACADAALNRGLVQRSLGRRDQALASLDVAIAIKPEHADAWVKRGAVMREAGRLEEALASFDAALAIRSRSAEDWHSRAQVLQALGRAEEALASSGVALEIRPDFLEALLFRASVLLSLRRFDAAQAAFDEVLALEPSSAGAFSGAVYCATNRCDWTRAGEIGAALRREETLAARLHPFAAIGFCDDPALHRRSAESWSRMTFPAPAALAPALRRHGGDKIRIAYLSADFRAHPTSNLIAQVFELHDRTRFDVVGVSFGPDDTSPQRQRVVRAFDSFLDVRQASDHDTARLLRELDIDIAIDLMAHTKFARPGILALRAAPIQVNYLGYPGTTGAAFLDYIIADPVVLPLDQQPHYSEQIVQLPDCYQPNDTARPISARVPTRAEMGLPETGVVFSCFNNSWKITEPLFAIWMRLLAEVEGSVLWLLSDTPAAQASLWREAEARGIDAKRLVFAERLPLADHLARQSLADLFLDTLPYNGHTTASDALWAGLPVVTCQGRAFAGRVAASLLTAIGLPELIATSLEAYEALALALARDPARLAQIRRRLAQNRKTHPLFDTPRFCRHLEAAYRTMCEIHWQGEPPRSFHVPAVSAPPAAWSSRTRSSSRAIPSGSPMRPRRKAAELKGVPQRSA